MVLDVKLVFRTHDLADFGALPETILTIIVLLLASLGTIGGSILALFSVRQEKPHPNAAILYTHLASYICFGASYASVYITFRKAINEKGQWSHSRLILVMCFCILELLSVSGCLLGIFIGMISSYQAYVNFYYAGAYLQLVRVLVCVAAIACFGIPRVKLSRTNIVESSVLDDAYVSMSNVSSDLKNRLLPSGNSNLENGVSKAQKVLAFSLLGAHAAFSIVALWTGLATQSVSPIDIGLGIFCSFSMQVPLLMLASIVMRWQEPNSWIVLLQFWSLAILIFVVHICIFAHSSAWWNAGLLITSKVFAGLDVPILLYSMMWFTSFSVPLKEQQSNNIQSNDVDGYENEQVNSDNNNSNNINSNNINNNNNNNSNNNSNNKSEEEI